MHQIPKTKQKHKYNTYNLFATMHFICLNAELIKISLARHILYIKYSKNLQCSQLGNLAA